MSFFSEKMKGFIVKEVLRYDHGWTILATDQSVLTIFNPSNIDLIKEDLIGKKYTNYQKDNNYFQVKFDGGVLLNISLKDEDWTGPEAFIVGFPNGEDIIVRCSD